MKFISSLLLVTTLALATISTGFAQVSPAPAPSTATKTAAVKTVHATVIITAVDATGMTFTSGKTTSVTYTVTPDTQIIQLDKTPGTFATLKVGDNVTVYYPKTATSATARTPSKITENSTKKTKKAAAAAAAKPSTTPAPAAAAQ